MRAEKICLLFISPVEFKYSTYMGVGLSFSVKVGGERENYKILNKKLPHIFLRFIPFSCPFLQTSPLSPKDPIFYTSLDRHFSVRLEWVGLVIMFFTDTKNIFICDCADIKTAHGWGSERRLLWFSFLKYGFLSSYSFNYLTFCL